MKQSTKLLNNPNRCVHIGDRESDIYELFCVAKEENTHFLIRTCVDRLAEDGSHTISKAMDNIAIKGTNSIKIKMETKVMLFFPLNIIL